MCDWDMEEGLFPYLQGVVDLTGKDIGVDLRDAMMDRARHRIRQNERTNVEHMQSAAATFSYREPVDGILSALSLPLFQHDDIVIRWVRFGCSVAPCCAIKKPVHRTRRWTGFAEEHSS